MIGKVLEQYFNLLLHIFIPNVRNPDLETWNIEIISKVLFHIFLFKFFMKFE
jgi:hypothetical protein